MRGGSRPGSGRKAGDAWATTKPKPIRDMANSRVREVLATKLDPLAVLVDISNDPENDVQVRVAAASAAAPYLFPRLSMSVVGTASVTAKEDGAHLVQKLMDRIARLAQAPQTIEAALVSDAAD
jgi:hypothetical protein